MVKTQQAQKDNYGRNIIISTLILFAVMLIIFHKLHNEQNITPYGGYSSTESKVKVYILKSKTTAYVVHQKNRQKSNYLIKLDTIKNQLKNLGYNPVYITENELQKLTKNDILFVLDAIALKKDTEKKIKSFVKNGGNLFFNFTCGFSDENGNFIGEKFITDLTKLKLSPKHNFLYFKDGLSLTQRLISALNNKNRGILIDTSIYDNVPIFITKNYNQADIYMTDYSQTNPPMAKNQNDSVSTQESVAAWHGYYGHGKWFYTNLPSYIFYDTNQKGFKLILKGIVDFLAERVSISKFPFVNKEKVVFISEDTEYKFKNFKKFSNLAKKYRIPVTAFIVSSIANRAENRAMVKEIARNNFVEFASHSKTHKKIVGMDNLFIENETSKTKPEIQELSHRNVVGFRPPREELDDTMKQYLANGGFYYVLGAGDTHLYPKFDKKQPNLLIIPRHGTDDYSYLINLDWGQDEIVKQIIKETNFVTNLDGLYTLSIHTHLFAFKSNINIVDKYFRYLKNHSQFTPMDGKTITKKVTISSNIDITYAQEDENTITVDITNNNSKGVKNFHFKLFKNPNLKIVSTNSQESMVRRYKKSSDSVIFKVNYLQPNQTTTIHIKVRERV